MSVKQINFNDYQNTYEQLDLTHAKQNRNLQVIGRYLFSQIAAYYNCIDLSEFFLMGGRRVQIYFLNKKVSD